VTPAFSNRNHYPQRFYDKYCIYTEAVGLPDAIWRLKSQWAKSLKKQSKGVCFLLIQHSKYRLLFRPLGWDLHSQL